MMTFNGSLVVFYCLAGLVCFACGQLTIERWNFDFGKLPYKTKCYGEIGCLDLSFEWYNFYRLINSFPLERNVINTQFTLYTETNPREGQLLVANDTETLNISNFNPEWSTKFIIHGFNDDSSSNWVFEMRDEMIRRKNVNVIVVDWMGGSWSVDYPQATANTRLVGLEIAYLLNKLQEDHGLRPADVHLIGHSLGAHTAGYASQRIPGIGRITGLDPAGPFFQGMGPHVRLDPSDATFVDVIHTDAKSLPLQIGYGISQDCGHIDFYPSGGTEQLGCAFARVGETLTPLKFIKNGLAGTVRELFACNHMRAIKLFIESINGECPFIAHRCPSYVDFLAGRCFECNDGNCAIMGYHATKPIPQIQSSHSSENEIPSSEHDQITRGSSVVPNKYFLITGKDQPFCQRQYRFTLEMAKPFTAKSWVRGSLTASIHSERGVFRGISLTTGISRLQHGSTYQIVVPNWHDLGDNIHTVELSWMYKADPLVPDTYCVWLACNLYVKSIKVEKMQMPSQETQNTELSRKLCAPMVEYAVIANGGSSIFTV